MHSVFLPHVPSHPLLLSCTSEGELTGAPGYKAIPGSSWQLQEVTATFLAHCPAAVKWHMLPYRWASSKRKKKERTPVCTRTLSDTRKGYRAKLLAGAKPWHRGLTACNRRGKRYGARQGDRLYYIQREACTCTVNARIHAPKYAQSQMLSCRSCQCHLCRHRHTGGRTMELYETEMHPRWA